MNDTQFRIQFGMNLNQLQSLSTKQQAFQRIKVLIENAAYHKDRKKLKIAFQLMHQLSKLPTHKSMDQVAELYGFMVKTYGKDLRLNASVVDSTQKVMQAAKLYYSHRDKQLQNASAKAYIEFYQNCLSKSDEEKKEIFVDPLWESIGKTLVPYQETSMQCLYFLCAFLITQGKKEITQEISTGFYQPPKDDLNSSFLKLLKTEVISYFLSRKYTQDFLYLIRNASLFVTYYSIVKYKNQVLRIMDKLLGYLEKALTPQGKQMNYLIRAEACHFLKIMAIQFLKFKKFQMKLKQPLIEKTLFLLQKTLKDPKIMIGRNFKDKEVQLDAKDAQAEWLKLEKSFELIQEEMEKRRVQVEQAKRQQQQKKRPQTAKVRRKNKSTNSKKAPLQKSQLALRIKPQKKQQLVSRKQQQQQQLQQQFMEAQRQNYMKKGEGVGGGRKFVQGHEGFVKGQPPNSQRKSQIQGKQQIRQKLNSNINNSQQQQYKEQVQNLQQKLTNLQDEKSQFQQKQQSQIKELQENLDKEKQQKQILQLQQKIQHLEQRKEMNWNQQKIDQLQHSLRKLQNENEKMSENQSDTKSIRSQNKKTSKNQRQRKYSGKSIQSIQTLKSQDDSQETIFNRQRSILQNQIIPPQTFHSSSKEILIKNKYRNDDETSSQPYSQQNIQQSGGRSEDQLDDTFNEHDILEDTIDFTNMKGPYDTSNQKQTQYNSFQNVVYNNNFKQPPQKKKLPKVKPSPLQLAWLQGLSSIHKGNFEQGFKTILNTKDDLYLIRLLMITGPKSLQYLTRNTANKIVMKLTSIMYSNYLEQLCLTFLEDGANKQIQGTLTVNEQNHIIQALSQLSLQKDDVGVKAQKLILRYQHPSNY